LPQLKKLPLLSEYKYSDNSESCNNHTLVKLMQIIERRSGLDLIANFDLWCDFITDGLDQLPDNGDSKQALPDDEE
jgi:hypothetical protein